jgi:hypothetical protein
VYWQTRAIVISVPRHYTDTGRGSEVLVAYDAPIGRGKVESTTRLVEEHVLAGAGTLVGGDKKEDGDIVTSFPSIPVAFVPF